MHQLVERFEQTGLLDDRRAVPAALGALTIPRLRPARTSCTARDIAGVEIPDAPTTNVCPPRPSASANAPVTTRRCRSPRCGMTVSKNTPASAADNSMHPTLHSAG